MPDVEQSQINVEFRQLFESAQRAVGLTQAQAGELIHIGQSYFSQLVTGEKDVQPKQLEFFKLQLAAKHHTHFNLVDKGSGLVLSEPSPESDAAFWRRRAKDAEERLEKFRKRVRLLYEETSATPLPQEPALSESPLSTVASSDAVSSKQDLDDAVSSVAAAESLAGHPTGSSPKHPTAAPTGNRAVPYGGALKESIKPPAVPKPVPK